jgi:hypothetical protein
MKKIFVRERRMECRELIFVKENSEAEAIFIKE